MKNLEPVFFLFTCVKDGRAYIEKLFTSLLNQTKKNFIHYIYEDGSTEPLDELVFDYIEKAKKLETPFEVIYEKCERNIGLNKATEHCLKKCNLKYFIWMNCDDWLDGYFFENAEKYVRKHPDFAIYRSRMISHFDGKTSIMPCTKKESKIFNKRKQLYPCLSYQFTLNHFIGNYSLLKQVNPDIYLVDNRLIYNDVQICLPFIFKNYKMGYIKDSISHYLYRDNSEYNGADKQLLMNFEIDKKAELFLENFGFYQKCLNYGNDFLLSLKSKNYKNALNVLKQRKTFLKAKHISNKKVFILNRSPIAWTIYCKLKLLQSK